MKRFSSYTSVILVFTMIPLLFQPTASAVQNFDVLNNSQCHAIGREAACRLHECQTPEERKDSYKLSISSLKKISSMPEVVDLSDPRIIDKFNSISPDPLAASGKPPKESSASIIKPTIDYHTEHHRNPSSYVFAIQGNTKVREFMKGLRQETRVDISSLPGKDLPTFFRETKNDPFILKVLRIKKRWLVACAVNACIFKYAFMHNPFEYFVLGNAAAAATLLAAGALTDTHKHKQSVDKMLYLLTFNETDHKEPFAYRMAVPLEIKYENGDVVEHLFELYLARTQPEGELTLVMGNRIVSPNVFLLYYPTLLAFGSTKSKSDEPVDKQFLRQHPGLSCLGESTR